MNEYLTDIILPVYKQPAMTEECVKSILVNTDTAFRLIVINNAPDEALERFYESPLFRNDERIMLIRNSDNLGWVRSVNLGFSLSDAPYICFMNNDTVVTKGWLRRLIDILRSRDEYGLISPEWEGKPAYTGIDEFGTYLANTNGNSCVETDWCRGFCVVLKKAVLDKIGKMDEAFGIGYYDDVDYSVRAIKAGFICLKSLGVYVHHHRNITAKNILKNDLWHSHHENNKALYFKKWGRPLKVYIVFSHENIAPSDQAVFADTIYKLAREQHHISVITDSAVNVKHTNVFATVINRNLLVLYTVFVLFLNVFKRPGKKFDGSFIISGSVPQVFGALLCSGKSMSDKCQNLTSAISKKKEQTKI